MTAAAINKTAPASLAARVSYNRLVELTVVREDDPPEVRNLYRGGDGLPADLSILDFLTLRDLVRYDGQSDLCMHALLMAMFLARNQGSLCVRVRADALVVLLATFLDDPSAAALAAKVEAWWATAGRNAAIVVDGTDPLPLTGKRFLPLVRSGDDVYFHRYFAAHRSTANLFKARLLTATVASPDLTALNAILRQVLIENPLRQNGSPVQLNAEQQCAVALSALRRMLIVSGGPGTGKTSTVFTLLRTLLRTGLDPARIRLAAPTGRAARRMTESIRAGFATLADQSHPADAALSQLAGATLHSLLDYDVGRNSFRFDAANPLPVDLVIVDEVSMVDVVLMARLLEAVPTHARLVLLGDKDQLPSVDAGAVLADLLPAGTQTRLSVNARQQLRNILGADFAMPEENAGPSNVPEDTIVVLRKNYRSQPHIQAVARAVNDGRAGIVEELPVLELPQLADGMPRWPALGDLSHPGGPAGGGCWLLEPKDESHWKRVLDAWGQSHFLEGNESYASLVKECAVIPGDKLPDSRCATELLDRLDHFRVLTLVREGTRGSQWVNNYLSMRLRNHLDPQGWGELFAGAPIMVVRNDHVRKVYNGDVGVCVRGAEGALRVIFRAADGLVAYAPDSLPPHELAFAVTVHKGQGSEYRQVLLALPQQADHRLLSRQIVYTGLTRAKDLVVIAGERKILGAAIVHQVNRRGGGLW